MEMEYIYMFFIKHFSIYQNVPFGQIGLENSADLEEQSELFAMSLWLICRRISPRLDY